MLIFIFTYKTLFVLANYRLIFRSLTFPREKIVNHIVPSLTLVRDHPYIMSAKTWVGGVGKMLMWAKKGSNEKKIHFFDQKITELLGLSKELIYHSSNKSFITQNKPYKWNSVLIYQCENKNRWVGFHKISFSYPGWIWKNADICW